MHSLKLWGLVGLFVASFLAGGCAFEQGELTDDESVGEAEGALEIGNALDSNALDSNALDSNALDSNGLNTLHQHGMSFTALSIQQQSSIQNPGPQGDLARQMLKYTVGCALDPTQSFSFSWTDLSSVVHNETYTGRLGLAPNWQSGPLPSPQEQWISACLLARVNWYTASVIISVRGGIAVINHPDEAERSTYAVREGAFWGNLFTTTPTAFACTAGNDAYARNQTRDCAAGHVNGDGTTSSCGLIQRVGSCASICMPPETTYGYYPSCGTGANASSKVITVSLD